MSKLYKGKFLIALYEKDDDTLVMDERGFAIFYSTKQLSQWLNSTENSVKSGIAHLTTEEKRLLFYNYRLHLIDCTEQNEGAFAEEDKLFLNFVAENGEFSNKQKAERLGVATKNFYRHKEYYNHKFETENEK